MSPPEFAQSLGLVRRWRLIPNVVGSWPLLNNLTARIEWGVWRRRLVQGLVCDIHVMYTSTYHGLKVPGRADSQYHQISSTSAVSKEQTVEHAVV